MRLQFLLIFVAPILVLNTLQIGLAGQERVPFPKNIVPGKGLVVDGDSAFTLSIKEKGVVLLRVQNKTVEEIPLPFQGIPFLLKSNSETVSQQNCLKQHPLVAGILPKDSKGNQASGIFCLDTLKNWKIIADSKTKHLRGFITAHESLRDQKSVVRLIGLIKNANEKTKRVALTWDLTSKEMTEEGLVIDQVLREGSVSVDASTDAFTFLGISESYELVSCSLSKKKFNCEGVKDAPPSVGSVSKIGSAYLLGTLSSMNMKSKKSIPGELLRVTLEKAKTTGQFKLTKKESLRTAQSVLAIESHPNPTQIHFIDFESFTQSALDVVKLPNKP